jgi:SAM-dependent methyltransferase
MPDYKEPYLFSGGPAELERIQLQARIWAPAAEEMLDAIGVRQGWHCVDMGCGAMGILEPLMRRTESQGRVVGIETDAVQLAALQKYLGATGLKNVEILDRDAYATGLPDASFDLTHARFLFAPSGRDPVLLSEMIRLTRPGGVIAIQEPDAASWNCHPSRPAWDKLKEIILHSFKIAGGDFDAGRRMYGLLRGTGILNVQVRAAVVALHDSHPYMRLPVQFAASLRQRIISSGIVSETTLDELMRQVEAVTTDPATFTTSFTLIQTWGTKPENL